MTAMATPGPFDEVHATLVLFRTIAMSQLRPHEQIPFSVGLYVTQVTESAPAGLLPLPATDHFRIIHVGASKSLPGRLEDHAASLRPECNRGGSTIGWRLQQMGLYRPDLIHFLSVSIYEGLHHWRLERDLLVAYRKQHGRDVLLNRILPPSIPRSLPDGDL